MGLVRDMPYAIRKRQGKWVVINEETRAVKGTHDTRKEAVAHLRALYANVVDAKPRRRKK